VVSGKFIMQYHNPNRLGKATQAAMELAERAKGFTSIEIQVVPHEEITRLKARIRLLEECRAVLEHAIELGYLGEGSTASWANDALKAARSVDD